MKAPSLGQRWRDLSRQPALGVALLLGSLLVLWHAAANGEELARPLSLFFVAVGASLKGPQRTATRARVKHGLLAARLLMAAAAIAVLLF
ncbi:MAG: hypothetical protein ABI895_08375 [Deltaproteobacteria bacterium]